MKSDAISSQKWKWNNPLKAPSHTELDIRPTIHSNIENRYLGRNVSVCLQQSEKCPLPLAKKISCEGGPRKTDAEMLWSTLCVKLFETFKLWNARARLDDAVYLTMGHYETEMLKLSSAESERWSATFMKQSQTSRHKQCGSLDFLQCSSTNHQSDIATHILHFYGISHTASGSDT